MIHRKTLRKRQPTAKMTLKKAKDIYKTMTVLHARQKFRDFKNAYKYLLTLAFQNEFYISSLQINNKALAKGLQKEKENSGQQLRERLATESMYFTLVKENSLLREKLSDLERKWLNIDQRITHTMIPNLVRLSDDVTVLKLSSDDVKNSLSISNNNNDSVLPKSCPKIQTAGMRHPLLAGTRIPSPLLEEPEEEVTQITTRKCKGGLRNILNMSNLRVTDRKMNRSLSLSIPNSEYSFVESNSNAETNADPRTPRPEHTSTPRYSPGTSKISPVRSSSPTVLLRRVLTPCNSIDRKDTSHSSISESSIEKSVDSLNLGEENTSHVIKKKDLKRSSHTSYFGETDENSSHCSLFTERKKSKRSHFFNNNNEDKQNLKKEPRKSVRRMSMALALKKEEANTDQSVCKTYRKRSSNRMSLSHMKEEEEDRDPSVRRSHSKKSLSKRKTSICNESELRVDHCTLLSDRKKYSRSQVFLGDDDVNKTSTIKSERKPSDLTINSFSNETTVDNSLDESRRLRNRGKNVCYKEKALNTKLRKN